MARIGKRIFAGYSAFCGQGVPAASPQRDAVGCGLMLNSSDWRTSSAKISAKLPSMTKTMIRRVTGNMSASSGWCVPPKTGIIQEILRTKQKCHSALLVSRRIQRCCGRPTPPMPANMIDRALRELKPPLNHHIRSSHDIKRDLPVRAMPSRHGLAGWHDGSLCRPTRTMLPRRWRGQTRRRQSVAIGEP